MCVLYIMEEIKENKKEEKIKKEYSLPELVDRIEKANIQSAELLKKHEELIAKRLIGGGTDATPQPEKKTETPSEYAKRILRGGNNAL